MLTWEFRATQSLLNELLFSFRKFSFNAWSRAAFRHFFPGLPQYFDHFGGLGLGDEIGKLILKCHQAERIFQDLAIRITAQHAFLDSNHEPVDRFLIVANFASISAALPA